MYWESQVQFLQRSSKNNETLTSLIKKKSELYLSNSVDMMKYQETGWHPNVGPPGDRNWKWLGRILFPVLNWTESKVIK